MIYLDNSATTRPFDAVVSVMSQCMQEEYYNVSAAYSPAMRAEKRVECVRAQLGARLSVRPERIVFTSGGTESDNLALLGSAKRLRPGARILCSDIEHPAVRQTMESLRQQGFELAVLPVDREGRLDLSAFRERMTGNTGLISIMQVNNETGAIQPVHEAARIAREVNPEAIVHCDGVQGFGRVPMRMGEIDLYSLSAHKFHGPKGVGALAVSPRVRLLPIAFGGGQEKGLRSGTLNSPGILGMGEALAQLDARGDVQARLRALKERLVMQLQGTAGIAFNGPDPLDRDKSAPHILSIRFEGVRGEVMRNALEGAGILVSTGSACSSHRQKVSPGLEALGLGREEADGTIRVSLGLFNTEEEMDTAATRMKETAQVLQRYRRR